MRVEFAIGTEKLNMYDMSFWCDLEIIPIKGQSVRVIDFLSEDDYDKVEKSSKCWSGDDAEVVDVTLKKDKEGWYYWIWLNCEDW